jgi:hypothetical protein
MSARSINFKNQQVWVNTKYMVYASVYTHKDKEFLRCHMVGVDRLDINIPEDTKASEFESLIAALFGEDEKE